jgi:hypothetical protein
VALLCGVNLADNRLDGLERYWPYDVIGWDGMEWNES